MFKLRARIGREEKDKRKKIEEKSLDIPRWNDITFQCLSFINYIAPPLIHQSITQWVNETNNGARLRPTFDRRRTGRSSRLLRSNAPGPVTLFMASRKHQLR